MSESLQTLLEAIYGSVLNARRFINRQHLQLFESYFETKRITDPDTGQPIEVYVPRLVAMATSKGVGEAETFDIIEAPVMSLLPLTTLAIDTLEIEFEAKIANLQTVERPAPTDTPEGEPEPKGLIRRTIDDLFGTHSELTIMQKGDSFESGAAPAKVKIVFKIKDPPEGVALIQEQMLDYLRN